MNIKENDSRSSLRVNDSMLKHTDSIKNNSRLNSPITVTLSNSKHKKFEIETITPENAIKKKNIDGL